jgi:hypothetical protein
MQESADLVPVSQSAWVAKEWGLYLIANAEKFGVSIVFCRFPYSVGHSRGSKRATLTLPI